MIESSPEPTKSKSSPELDGIHSLDTLLTLNLGKDWVRIHADLFKRLKLNFSSWEVNPDELEGIKQQNWQVIQFVQFLLQQVNQWLEQSDTQQRSFNEFAQKYHKAANVEEAREYLLQIAQTLGYSKKAQNKITRNKAKWLDENAIYDGHIKRLAALEQDISNTLKRLGDILQHLLSRADADSVEQIWQLLSLHVSLQEALRYQGNIHIRIGAFGCLSQAITALPEQFDHRMPANIVQYIYRTCLDEGMDIWLRSEAINLVSRLEPAQFYDLIDKIFVGHNDSDIFLRGRVAQLLFKQASDSDNDSNDKITTAVAIVSADPSDYVRMSLARSSIALNPQLRLKLLLKMLETEVCSQVRAQIYLTLAESVKAQDIEVKKIQDRQIEALASETDLFVLRVLMHTLPICAAGQVLQEYVQKLQAPLNALHQHHDKTAVRRWAAKTREYLWAMSEPKVSHQIQDQLAQLPLHQSMSFELPKYIDKQDVHRHLALIGSERFGFDVQDKGEKIKVRAGFKFGFRFWRFWHELRNPATDKRQNHNHLKGRHYYGLIQTATRQMAELSVTKVPGEPLFMSGEQGWREYLPLLDQVLSSLDQNWPTKPVKLYSCEGITSIMPPSNLFARLYARTAIQFKFAKLAALRNWKDGDSYEPNEYLQQLQQLGFAISIEGYLDEKGKAQPLDARVERFFPSVGLPFTLPGLADMQNYFYSVYQNTIGQLLAFTVAVTVGYLGTHINTLVQMRKARKKIPLVVGGWGTRGKSGTERLKAALFNSMGLSVLSKTTGCEAMFLFGPANRPMKEMFLFRPYDKASIWEQVFLARLTAKLGADVFLWECMGLTPRYIDIIQNQWMRDDVATITNCYPDHEDLQGPAGIEIPIVMQRFVPHKSTLIASEESMLPLLEDAARQKRTELQSVTWLDAGLLTDDVVSRFPYEEHPNNIALVARLAKTLNIPEDFALKAMADNVVADLGVLKIYPVAEVEQRNLAFINGMSANERLGAMGNWQRTGLVDLTLQDNADTWLAIVINNRADRIARSKVFASMLVNDTQADCYFFIGNNLSGFKSYIEEAWQSFATGLKLDSKEKLTALASKFRIPTSEQQVLARLRACLEGISADTADLPQVIDQNVLDSWTTENEAVQAQFKRDGQEYLEYSAFADSFDGAKQNAMVDWLFKCFKNRWVVVDDYYSTGNQTINVMVKNTPPGLLSRVIGMQNIKGTGLDFIYRWQAWDQVHDFCEQLLTSRDELVLEAAAKALTTWEEFGLLDQQKVRDTLVKVKDRSEAQTELVQAQLHLIEQRLDKQLSLMQGQLDGSKSQSKWLSWLLSATEAFLDAGDAIKRRKRADEIYQAILDNLISYDKASVELAKITKAQKGGWLEQRFNRMMTKDG